MENTTPNLISDAAQVEHFKASRHRQATWQAALVTATVCLITLSPVLAQANVTSGGKNDPSAVIKTGICGKGLMGFVTNPVFVGVALAIGVAIWGWSQYFGQMDSTVALKRGFIGMVAVLCCATIAGFFVSGC